MAISYFANDKVIRKLRTAAVTVVSTARDAALNTREGQALANAVLQHAPALHNSGGGSGRSRSSGPQSASEASSSGVKLSAVLRAGEKGAHPAAVRVQISTNWTSLP